MSLGILAIVAALGLLAMFAIPRLARRVAQREGTVGPWRVSWLMLSQPRLLTALLWIALSWSACLTAAIPNLLAMAKDELKPPSGKELPQLFVINLRGEDVEPLATKVKGLGGELRHVSPLILGRLLKQNGQPVKDDRLARFPVRLTYRPRLSESERLVAGEPLPPGRGASGTVMVSVEKDFAERNEFRLNDTLEFEVAGLPLLAKIGNLREVQWNTFQPNFFMQFSSGVLEEFPKSFIGVIYGLDGKELFATQAKISSDFPSLSLLNLATTIERLSDLIQKMLLPIVAISFAGLAFCLLIVAALSFHLWRERLGERQLFHWLGANLAARRRIFALENLWLSGSAIGFGAAAGLGLAALGGYRVFERWQWPTFWWLSLILACLALGASFAPQFRNSQH